jgi:hypothetical protein
MGFASHVCKCNFRSCIWALQMNLILVVVLHKIGTQQYKNQCKNLLIFFLVVFGGMVIKHKVLWGISEKQNTCACEHFVFWNVWAFHVMPHVNFYTGWHLRGAYFQDSLVLTTSSMQAPCSSGVVLPQTHTSKACTQMNPTHTSITIQINNGAGCRTKIWK